MSGGGGVRGWESVCDHHGAVIAWWGSDRGVSE